MKKYIHSTNLSESSDSDLTSSFISVVPGDLFFYLFSFVWILIVVFVGHLEKCH